MGNWLETGCIPYSKLIWFDLDGTTFNFLVLRNENFFVLYMATITICSIF
jgi:hypothetical protein